MEKSSLTEKGRAVLFCACAYWNESGLNQSIPNQLIIRNLQKQTGEIA